MTGAVCGAGSMKPLRTPGSGQNDLAGGAGTPRVAETPSARIEVPDAAPHVVAPPSRPVTPAGAG
jgi:hypothetical protein